MVNTARGTLADLLVLASKRERSSIDEKSRVVKYADDTYCSCSACCFLARVLSLLVRQI